MADRVVVLLVASGAAWEPEALAELGADGRVVLLKRCVDVDDLLAAATAGQADAAVIGLDAPGLDRAAVEHLRTHGVRAVAISPAGDVLDAGRERAGQIGIAAVVGTDRLGSLPDVLAAGGTPTVVRRPDRPDAPGSDGPPAPPEQGGDARASRVPGMVVAVWGPAGGGRSTLAAALAAEIARRHRRSVLVDADPAGGSIAQQLGVLDEVSGLLAAARLDTAGQLEARFGSVQRGLDRHLSVVTGLPRADRWTEVRGGVVERLLRIAGGEAEVVVDTGSALDDDPVPDLSGRPGRHQMTTEALDAADETVVVGSADPVGLSRLARALVAHREHWPGRPLRVVVNRMRPTLGWSEREIAGMVEGFVRSPAIHFLPDDQVAVDRALVAGRTLAEAGESDLTRAVGRIVDDLLPALEAP